MPLLCHRWTTGEMFAFRKRRYATALRQATMAYKGNSEEKKIQVEKKLKNQVKN